MQPCPDLAASWGLAVRRWGLASAMAWALMAPAGAGAAGRPVAIPGTEVQVTPARIIDYEFDWGRDGVNCPTCNGGDGNSRLAFTDAFYNLWVAHVDPTTGAFIPADGKGVLVDTMAAFATDFGNGPEWALSQLGSQLVYTKYSVATVPPTPADPQTAELAVASQSGGVWAPVALDNGDKKQSPLGTQDASDAVPLLQYQDLAKVNTFWRVLNVPQSQVKVPVKGYNAGSRRWVPGTHKMILSARGLQGTLANGFRAVFLYDADTGALEQITNEAANNQGAMMWRAPEYGGDFVFFTVRDGQQLVVYRQVSNGDGSSSWVVISTVAMPAATPYVWSPEYFIHNGKSYIFFQMNTTSDSSDMTQPSRIGMVGILPENAALVDLTPANAPDRVRMDPEYFITTQGPFIYYNRYKPQTDTKPFIGEGVWRVDTQLGPPVTSLLRR